MRWTSGENRRRLVRLSLPTCAVDAAASVSPLRLLAGLADLPYELRRLYLVYSAMPPPVSLLALAVATLAPFVRADAAVSLASQYSLTSTTIFPFPTQTMNSSAATPLITQGWALARDSIQQGGADLAFVPDPFPSSSSSNSSAPVLQVTYPAGSYSHQTGGAQFVNTWNGAALGSVVVTYEVAFPAGFDFVKGGKLPGVRGGPQVEGCSGGRQPSGTDCFSTRLMWRTGGAGESAYPRLFYVRQSLTELFW
jgi:hypothetical protein